MKKRTTHCNSTTLEACDHVSIKKKAKRPRRVYYFIPISGLLLVAVAVLSGNNLATPSHYMKLSSSSFDADYTFAAPELQAAHNLVESSEGESPPTSPSVTRLKKANGPSMQNDMRAPIGNTRTAVICAVFKNDTLYVDEWIDFHFGLGFNSIYIYDNSDEFLLEQWNGRRSDGEVKVRHFPGGTMQKIAYNQCVKEFARNDTWVAFFDSDEFLVLKRHDNVLDFVEEHCQGRCGQLSINWLLFGTANETKYKPLPVTKRFLYRTNFSGTVKVIARVEDLADDIEWNHSVRLKRGKVWRDTNGRFINNRGWKRMINDEGTTDVAALHHYRFKSVEEFRYRQCVRGHALDPDFSMERCTEKLVVGSVFDDAAWDLLKKVAPKYRTFDGAQS